jgi:HD superfamily phosphohydrolase
VPTRHPSSNRELAAELALAEPATVMRDSVWRSIPLYEPELALIDSQPFQRLRRVQQLGFASWVFPGAHHTRFEHSIGVYHLTRRILLRLLRLDECPALSRSDVAALLATALLHDIGHYPFSHAADELELNVMRNHEEISQEIILAPPIADILRSHWDVEPERAARLLSRHPLRGIDGLLQDLLSGTLDVDKLDYLIRDARHCNVPYGEVDVDRIIEAMRVYHDVDGTPRLALSDKGIGPYQSLVFARYMMFFNIYWHHTSRICTMMFMRAVQDGMRDGSLTPVGLERLDDSEVLALLRSRSAEGSTSADLAGRLFERRLYKRALEYVDGEYGYSVLSRLRHDPAERRRLECDWCRHLASATGASLRGHEVLIDVPEEKSFRIEMPLVRRGADGRGERAFWDRRAGLDDELLATLQRRIRRVRIVVADDSLARQVIAHERALLEIVENSVQGQS